MTNEEAIKWIKYHIGISGYAETDDLLKAFEKARISMHWFSTKEQAVEAWERRCKE